MLERLNHLYRSKKGLIKFFSLTYLDKILSFATPLLILFIIRDRPLYNTIEVVFSYATLLLSVVELGSSTYLYWGYKSATDREKFVAEAKTYFDILQSLYCLLSLIGLSWIYFAGNPQLLTLVALVTVRTLFTFYINFHSNIFRLKDNPSGIYATSIGVSISSLVLVLAAFLLSLENVVLFFFLPSALVLVGTVVRMVFSGITRQVFRDFLKFIKDALAFAWPIMLNALLMTFVNNYSKIYAFNHLAPEEMTQISYVLRIGLIVQLTHTSIASYYSKQLFMDTNGKFNRKIFQYYSAALLASVLMVIILIVATNGLFPSLVRIPLDWSTLLFVLYIYLWCYIGYLELYFGVMNANRLILYYSVASSIVYIVLLRIYSPVTILHLASSMFISGCVNLVLVIIGLRKLGIK